MSDLDVNRSSPPAGDSDPDELSRLVIDALAAHEARGPSGVAELLRANPRFAQQIEQRLASLARAGLLGPREATADFPECLGDFRLIRRLGGGGMGVVYLAEQVSVRRSVALKLIRPDQLYFPNVRERFRREIDAVARFSHPSIAQVFAVGEDQGVPYYAMEFVPGVSLERVLIAFAGRDPATLSAQDLALELARSAPDVAGDIDRGAPVFQGTWDEACLRIAHDAALALAHAHARGVLHRDLKPANLMLSPDGRVRLVDFGLAVLVDDVRLTRTGSQLGSPAYMAPEQINGQFEAIGPRTDIYGLGVTLFELLTLSPAFGGASAEVVLKRILLGDPLSAANTNRRLSRDADTVCAKAMEREIPRRYDSATDFARDLEHVLEHRPISARRTGPLGRALRWSQRRPAAATAVALAILLVIGGPLLVAVQQSLARASIEAKNRELDAKNVEIEHALATAKAETARAQRETKTRERTLHFFYDLFNAQSPDEARGATVTVKQVLDRGALEIEHEFADEPVVRADLMSAMAGLYAGLGLHKRAAELYAADHALLSRLADAEPISTYRCATALASECIELDRLDEAEALLYGAREGLVPLVGEEDELVLAVDERLAKVLRLQSKMREAEALLRRVLRAREARDGEASESVASTLEQLAEIYGFVDAYDESERCLWRALEILRARFGEDHPLTIDVLSNVGYSLGMHGAPDEGEVCAAEAVELAERVLRDDHPTTMTALNNLSVVRRTRGDLLGAETMLREAYARWRRNYGDDHYQTVICEQNLGANLRRQKRFEECEELLLDAFARARRTAGEMDILTLYIEDQIASLYDDWHRFDTAAQFARDLVQRTPANDDNCRRWNAYAEKLEAIARTLERAP